MWQAIQLNGETLYEKKQIAILYEADSATLNVASSSYFGGNILIYSTVWSQDSISKF